MDQWLEDRLASLAKLEGYNLGPTMNRDAIRAKLELNENWHIPADELQRILTETAAAIDMRKYPLNEVLMLRAGMAKHIHLPENTIIPTQGADQAIDLLCQTFIREGDKAVIVGPTFSFYRLRAAFAGAQLVEVNMNNDLSLPVESILNSTGTNAEGIIFICSPNNPTGNQYSTADLLHLTERFHGLVVIDEAYVDFADHSVIDEVTRRRNLVVVRTFSKAFGMANLRLGFIMANPEWATTFLEHAQYPFPVSSLTANVALRLLQNFQIVKKGIESLKQERKWLLQELAQIKGVQALNSQANFILLNLPVDAAKAHRLLLENGIATKMVGRVLTMPNCLRVTVGTKEMNASLLETIKEMLKKNA